MSFGPRARVVGWGVLLVLACTGGCGGGAGGGAAPSTDAALLTLVPSAGALSPEFDPEVTSYAMGMVGMPTLQWTPTARDEGATIVVQGMNVGSGALSQSIALPVGPSSITVVVTAEDGVTKRTYTVTLDHTSAQLAGLATDVGALSPGFEPTARDFVVGPLLAIETATVTATVLDPRATITVNGIAVPSGQPSAALPLAMGDTPASVLVTAGDGVTIALYTVVFARTSAVLSGLTISEGTFTPAFDPGTTAYGMGPTLLGPTVTVTPTSEAPNATITVNGAIVASGGPSAPLPLAMGTNQVTVVVLAAGNLATRTYTLVLDRTSTGLSGLTASTGDLVPAFAEATYAYVVEAGLLPESTTVTPTTADPHATLTINTVAGASGEKSADLPLAGGPNPITVTVTARDGTEATYTVVVRRGLRAPQASIGGTTEFSYASPSGVRVAIDGDTLAVSDVWDATSSYNPGFVYVYVRVGSSWIQQAKLTASNAGDADFFGKSVSLSGDTLVVGAPMEDSSATGVGGDESSDGAKDSGAAYVFVRSGTTWSQQAYLKASNTDAGDYFGYSVAVEGDVAVIGASSEDSAAAGVDGDQGDGSNEGAGAAYVFVRNGTTWSQQAYLKASNTSSWSGFGHSVALSGETVVVGAPGEDNGGTGVDGDPDVSSAANAGAAYVFVRQGTTWSQQAYLKASNTDAGDQFGCSVAISGDTAVVGALLEDSEGKGVDAAGADNGRSGSGAAYVFVRSGATWSQQVSLKASNTDNADLFGASVAISGGVIAVGAPGEEGGAQGVDGDANDDSLSDAGATYVFVRTGTTWSAATYAKAAAPARRDELGCCVAVSGDTVAALGGVINNGLTVFR